MQEGITLHPKKVPGNNPYLEDASSGLWEDFAPVPKEQRFPLNQEPYVEPIEQRICDALAKQIHAHLKDKENPLMIDVANRSRCMILSFEKLGYKTSLLKDFTSLKTPTDVFTFVNTFQKLTSIEAKEALFWSEENLSEDGVIFIRLNDREASGVENKINEWPTTPTFWHLESFLELLAQVNKFKIVQTYQVFPGHRDIYLKKITKTPTICAGLIAKNEQRDLPICLNSLEGVIDSLVLLDTGSTDNTMDLAKTWCEQQGFENYIVEQYLEASEKDPAGDWKLWDFGKARNKYVELIEDKIKTDYVLWMDADDKVLTPRKLKNLTYLDCIDVHGLMIESGGIKWPHHRLWKTKNKVRYKGRCHEYPDWGNAPTSIHSNIIIKHDTSPHGISESSNTRNLRILEREFQEDPSPRTAFYLANTHKDAGRFKEAIPYYKARMDFGKGFEEEYWFAALYKARCERAAGFIEESKKTILTSLIEKPDWAELWMELCYLEMSAGNYKKSIGWALQAADLPVAPSTLFREKDKYTDQPYRMISWNYEYLGDIYNALIMANKAKEYIKGPDIEWDQRIDRLKKITNKTKRVCFYRKGALGDILMTLNLIEVFKKENPSTEIYYQCAASSAKMLGTTLLASGVDKVLTTEQDLKDFAIDKFYNLVGYPFNDGYPEKPMKKHLIRYFAKEIGIEEEPEELWSNKLPFVKLKELPEKYVTVHIQAGWSVYKNWSFEKWEQVCKVLKERGVTLIQIGGPGDTRLTNVHFDLLGASFEKNLMAIAGASAHLGIDSWSNNATHFTWGNKGKIPAVILWGSSQVLATGYSHNQNLCLNLPCQPCFREDPKISVDARGPCINPPNQVYEKPQHACMEGLSVGIVLDAFTKIYPLEGS